MGGNISGSSIIVICSPGAPPTAAHLASTGFVFPPDRSLKYVSPILLLTHIVVILIIFIILVIHTVLIFHIIHIITTFIILTPLIVLKVLIILLLLLLMVTKTDQCHCDDGWGGVLCEEPDLNECKYRPCSLFAHVSFMMLMMIIIMMMVMIMMMVKVSPSR